MAKKPIILGIDLGTTFSLASLRLGDGQYLPFTTEPGGDQLVPSVFLHMPDGTVLVGAAAEAEEKFEEHRPHVVRHVKRYMNRNYSDGTQEPETFLSHGKEFLPYEISGYILRALKEAAEREIRSPAGEAIRANYEWLGQIYSAVITVPAYFGPSERQATRDAAKFAGFSPANVELLDEPVAAALSLGLHQEPGERIILVVDVGGGTTDITLLKVGRDVDNGGFLELGRIGDSGLGGVDIDQKIVHDTIYSTVTQKKYSVDELDALEDSNRQGPFFARAETEKKKICREMLERKGVYGEVIYREPVRGERFQFRFTEQWFRENTDYFVEYVARLCDFLLRNVDRHEAGKGGWRSVISTLAGSGGRGLAWKEVDQVWMVGGSSLMPHLQERILSRLKDPRKLKVAPRPQHAVAEGAAVYADMVASGQPLKGIAMPRCPCDIGVMTYPRRTGWEKLKDWLSGRKESQGLEFFPLIRSNTLLSDERQRTQRYRARTRPGPDGTVRIPICQRFVGQVAGAAPSSEMHYSIRQVRRLTIPDLPPLNGTTDLDTVSFEVTYEPTHTLRFTAEYRGHKLKPIEVREGEFNMLFKADALK